MQKRRLIATVIAVLTIGALLAGCPSAVTPAVKFSAGQLTISLSSMVVGQPISETLPEATGGEETLVYTLEPEVPGLTFDAATRVLSGTPTTPGTYDMTYTAKDSATGGTMESVTFTIAVVAPTVTFAPETLTIPLPRMQVGEPVLFTLPAALRDDQSGEGTLVYTLAPEVPGLTFDPATRVLSGTPTTPGTYDMTYTAKDSVTGGTMESVTFVITVDPRPLTNREILLGTWQNMDEWWDDGELTGTWVAFLTFTETRFIFVRSHFHMDGTFYYAWQHQGTWEITDQEIVRIWYHNDDDVDETPDVLLRLPKSYFFYGDKLFVHHWADENVEDVATNYDGMTRVVDASLSLPPLGIWEREQYEDESDWFEIETMTLKPDGRFTLSVQDPNGTWTLTAEWELDLDNYFINLKNATATWTETGGEPEPSDDSIDGARFLRFAYAPMMSESGERRLRVSGYNNELEAPYGEYWREMKLQQ